MIVNHMKATLLGPELVRSLYDESLVEEVLQEAVEVQQLRKQTKERMAVRDPPLRAHARLRAHTHARAHQHRHARPHALPPARTRACRS